MHSSALLLALLPLPLSLALPSPRAHAVAANVRHQDRSAPSAVAGSEAFARNAHVRKSSESGFSGAPRPQRKVRRQTAKKACSVSVSVGAGAGGGGSDVTLVSTASTDTLTTPDDSSAVTGGTTTTSLMDSLFPLSGANSWSTAHESPSKLSFTSALKPLTAGKLPPSSTAPDGSPALIANYPANTFQYSSSTGHGFSFYTEGAHNKVVVEGAQEILFSYSAFFPDGFDFVRGGKMPGVYGGTSLEQAKSCSGGRQDRRDECFSARLMWRTDGAGEFYNYYPTSVQQGNGYCQTAPYSICDTVYGDSIGRGSFTWSTGQWTTVAQRIKLNDVGSANGEQQLWVDGQPVLNLSGLEIIVKPSKLYGIFAQTFFGGSDATWASPTDQSAWFKDWSLAVIS